MLSAKQPGRLVLADEESIENLLNEMERVRDIYDRQLEALRLALNSIPGSGSQKLN